MYDVDFAMSLAVMEFELSGYKWKGRATVTNLSVQGYCCLGKVKSIKADAWRDLQKHLAAQTKYDEPDCSIPALVNIGVVDPTAKDGLCLAASTLKALNNGRQPRQSASKALLIQALDHLENNMVRLLFVTGR